MKLKNLYLTPKERLQNLLIWTINAETEEEYCKRKAHFERYLEKMYKRKIKDNLKNQNQCKKH